MLYALERFVFLGAPRMGSSVLIGHIHGVLRGQLSEGLLAIFHMADRVLGHSDAADR